MSALLLLTAISPFSGLAEYRDSLLQVQKILYENMATPALVAGFEEVGPEGGLIQDIAVDPVNPDLVYAAGVARGWRSTDGGGSWEPLSAQFPLAVAAPLPNVVVFYQDGSGIQYSDDGGNTFNPRGGVSASLSSVRFTGEKSGTVYAAGGTGGLLLTYYSNDGGNSWTSRGTIVNPAGDAGCGGISFVSDSPHVVTVAMGTEPLISGPGMLGVWVSSDYGAGWTLLDSISDYYPSIGNNVLDVELALRSNDSRLQLFVSTDTYIISALHTGGASFSNWTYTPSDYGADLFYLPNQANQFSDTLLLACGPLYEGIRRYEFLPATNTLNLIDTVFYGQWVATLDRSSPSSNSIWAGTGGEGVLFSPDLGATWDTSRNSGLRATVFLGPGAVIDHDSVLLAMSLSGLIWRTTDQGGSWQKLGFNGVLLGFSVGFNPDHPDTMYAGAFYYDGDSLSGMAASTDAGLTWFRIGNLYDVSNPERQILPDKILVPGSTSPPGKLYAQNLFANGGVKYSLNMGQSWTYINVPDYLLDWVQTDLGAGSGRMYYATTVGLVFSDDDINFTNVPNFDGSYVTTVAYDPDDRAVYAADTQRGLWKANGGNWKNVFAVSTSGFTSVDADPFWDVVFSYTTPNLSGYRVAYSSREGNQFTVKTVPFPTSASAVMDTGWMLIATAGEGFFRSDSLLEGFLPSFSIALDPNSPNVGDTAKVNVSSSLLLDGTPVCTVFQDQNGDTVLVSVPLQPEQDSSFRGTLPVLGLNPGQIEIAVEGVDRFGNLTADTAQFTIGGGGALLEADSVYFYPNPAPTPLWGRSGFFRFFVNENAEIRVEVYNLKGQLVQTLMMADAEAGVPSEMQEIEWDLSAVPSGLYTYRVVAKSKKDGDEETVTKKLAVRK